MTKSNGSAPAPKPGTPEWQPAIEEHDAKAKASGNSNQTFEISQGKAKLTVRAFGQWLRSVWVADLMAEPEPTMGHLVPAVGGAA